RGRTRRARRRRPPPPTTTQAHRRPTRRVTDHHPMATSPDFFSHAHIALTAATTGVLSAAVAAWRLRGRRIADSVAAGALVGLSVYLWRASANLPQLNKDGISGYSA